MKQFLLSTVLLCTLLLGANTAKAQTQFWSDNFEDSGAPSSGTRTPSTTFAEPSSPYTRYFDRLSSSQVTLQSPYVGLEGSKFWAGEDLDNRGGTNGVVSANNTITWSNINIAGKTGLSFKGLFAAGDFGTPWEGIAFAPNQDYLMIEYSIDGGAWIKALGIYSSVSTLAGGLFKVDTDGDLVGDGTTLGYTATELTCNISGTGTTLSLRFNCFANGTSTEEFAIDNFRLFETPSCTAPTITGNPSNRSICVNSNTTFTGAATGATAYQWQVNTGSGFIDIANGGVYSNATTTTLNITGATASMNGYTYRLKVINGAVTCYSNTNIATLNISNITSSTAKNDVLCFGNSSGSAAVAPNGGIGTYTYSWSPSGGTSSIATGLAAGTYTVSITDAIPCSITKTITINQPASALNTTAGSKTDISCNGGSNGTATVAPTGGTTAYTYSWAPSGGTNATATGLVAGAYTVTVTDANSCQGTKTFAILQPSAITSFVSSQTNIACNGGSNGSATISVSGGTGTKTYSWAPSGGTAATATGLAAGVYTVSIEDANTCIKTQTVAITQPPAITSSVSSQTNVSCNGGSNGSATITASGGTGTLSYSWAPSGGTAATATGLAAGVYTVNIEDANTCTKTQTVAITQPTAITSSVSTQTNVACNGGSNGSATITASGGTGTKTYSWAPSGGTNATATGLAAGVYTVSINDANTCSKLQTVAITQPSAITSFVSSQTNVACNGGSNGSATITASGGTGTLSYSWAPSGGTNATATGLAAGVYTVSIQDLNTCSKLQTVSISQPTAITSSVSTQTNVSCNGGSNGSATITASGGTGTLSYSWAPSGGTAATATGLAAGVYTVSIQDLNTCIKTQTVAITQPTAITSSVSTQTNVACNGGSNGSATITASGGTGTLSYSWAPSGGTAATATGLAAGVYTVNIEDANTCTKTQTVAITQPTAITSSVSTQTNVACNGGSNGSATITASGGTGTKTYSWAPSGGTNATATGLAAGVYTVSINDANTCSKLQTVAITQPSAITSFVSSQTNVACNGGTTGSATISVSGGTGTKTYSWAPSGGTAATATGLAAGVYTVNIEDANTCTKTQTVAITQPTAISATVSATNATCSAADGSASVVASGGTGTLSYSWAPSGGTAATATGLAAGTYTVSIEDANTCSITRTVTIGTTVNLVVTPSQTNVSCNGGSNGVASVSVTGGATPYTYSWAPSGGTNATATGLAAGAYTVTITDNVACQTTQTFTLTQPTAITGTSVTTNVACFSGANGAINFTASGGTSPYTFVWSNGATTEDISGLVAGAYTVTVADNNNCTASFNATVTQPATITASATVTNSLCSGLSNGSINLSVTGGTGAYTYVWSNGATTEDVSGLADGTYMVTITDANACTATASATLQSPIAVTTVATATNVSCNGGNNGKVVLSSTGGTTPYTYAWSTGAIIDSIVNRVAGIYSYTVTDANGCSVSGSSTITQPAALAINTTVTANVLCFGGSTGAIDATVTGGTAPYTYAWSNGTTNEDLSNATAGAYALTVTDANSCQISKGAGTITQPASALAVNVDSTKDVSCNNGANGAIYITIAGGTSPYTKLWSNTTTAEDATGLAAGTYTVTVTDNNACSATASAAISQPSALSYDTAITNVLCNGASTGLIDVTAIGGTAPYTYLWSNTSTNEDLTNAAAGAYTLTITDGLSCTLVAGPFVLAQPTAFGGSVDSIIGVKCFGQTNGAIYITASGSTPPYTYLWSNGATTQDIVNVASGAYALTVTDANACTFSPPVFQVPGPSAALSVAIAQANNPTCNGAVNGSVNINVAGGTAPYTYLWSNGATTEDITGLGIGAYTVTITDSKACATVSQTATLTQPTVLTGSATTIDISCNGGNAGSINLTVSGGTVPYTYAWSNAAITEDISGLTAGTYAVTITDANTCTLTVSATVTQPALLTASAVATNALCNGANGSIDLTIAGGTQPYGFNWSNSATTEDLSAVAANTYSVTVNDNNGCTATATATVNQPAAITIAGTVTNALCNGNANGDIDITATGGTGSYSFAWSNSESSEDVTGLVAGAYTVTVTDVNSCTGTATFTVTEPAVLSLAATSTDASCNGDANGEIDLTVTGGTAPFDYAWSNTETTQDVDGLTAGTYTVSVTDDNGCSATATATIAEPVVLAASALAVDVSCNGLNNGSVDLTATGGTSPYTYLWSNAATTQDITGLNPNTYTVTVTDDNGCTATATATVTQPAVLAATTAVTNAACNGATGNIDVTVAGGTTPYTYVWGNSASTEDIADVAGTYTVTITDGRGCSVTTTATITQPAAIAVQAQVSNVSCPSGTNGGVNLTVSGGTGAYTYVWSNGATSEDIAGLVAGTYVYTVTDANACSATGTYTVNQPAAIAAAEIIQNVTCNGTGDGAIDITVTGGTGTYAYLWSNGATTSDLAGLGGGSYSVTVTDYNLCTAVFGPYAVVEPLPLAASLDSFNMVSCFGANTGNVYVTLAGGTMPYTYAWSNGASTEDLVGVPAGVYTGTVTDANGCTFVSPQIPVTQPAAAVSITVDLAKNVTCNGLADGEITVTGAGGTGTLTYTWSNASNATQLTGLTPNTYDVSVVDDNGCSATASVTITEPAVLAITPSGTNITCDGANNGAVSVATTGGTTPYTTLWSSSTTSNLAVGTYTVTVTDANLCSATGSVELTSNGSNPVVELGADITQCGGTVNINSGVSDATYAWSNGGTAQSTVVGASGTYSVTVTTAIGCTATDDVDVTINTIPQVSFNVADTICVNADPITLTASPAGGTFAGTLVSGNVFTPSAAGEQAISYTYTDGNNCSATAHDTISVVICVGVEDIALATKLNVYPIPNNGSFTVTGAAFAKCELTNNIGQSLQYFELNTSNDYTYNVQNISAGVYYVLATNGTARATYKVLVIE